MQDALKRLRALQLELESLHRTTAKVLAESERLIGELEAPVRPAVPIPVPSKRQPTRPRAPLPRRTTKRAR